MRSPKPTLVLSPQPQHEPVESAATTAVELLGRDVPQAPVDERAPPQLEPELSVSAPELAGEPVPARRSPWLVLGLQVGALLAFAYLCLFNLSVVRGSSMAPRIHDGDRILIDHLSYVFGEVQRGDIVVLKYPLDPSVDYIKRVVGLPGDEVLLEDGEVWVNGVRIDEPYVDEPDPFSRQRVRVKPAHFFVLGDNRPRSSDSREFGLVPQDYIRGRVELRVWPPERAGPIDAD